MRGSVVIPLSRGDWRFGGAWTRWPGTERSGQVDEGALRSRCAREAKAVVVELNAGRAVLEFEDGGRRELAVPEQIEVAVGMCVRIIDIGDDAPVVAWGV